MVTEQTEIPFVPVSERHHTTSAAADTIITVGQRSHQKRKRKRNTTSNGAEDDIEMFDFTVEPSPLDGGDMKGVGPVAKKRNKGKDIPISQSRTGDPDGLTRPSTNGVRKFPSSSQSPQSAEER